MLKGSFKDKTDDGPKDDVVGESVTANNASARLSSLKHVPEALQESKKDVKASRYENTGDQSSSSDDSLLAGVEEKKKGESASDDSGYRESNDSREETSSSGSDTSQSNGKADILVLRADRSCHPLPLFLICLCFIADRRKKSLAPTCRMCLIRDDLTTVWCEVTSSIRDRSMEDDGEEKAPSVNPNASNYTLKLEQKELLLCLRPIRDGEKKVDESLRFRPVSWRQPPLSAQAFQDPVVSTSSGDNATEQKSGSSLGSSNKWCSRPPMKRSLPTHSSDSFSTTEEPPTKKQQKAPKNSSEGDTEKSVVESLMLMNKSSQ